MYESFLVAKSPSPELFISNISKEDEMSTGNYDLEAILCRLKKLEKQNRRFKFAGILVFFSLLVLGLAAWTQSEYYDYQGQFFLRDKLGNIRGALAYNAETNYGMLWLGKAGKNVGETKFSTIPDINLTYDDDGFPEMNIYDKLHNRRISTGFSTGHQPGLWLYDSRGETRAWLGLDQDGDPNLELYNAKGQLIWQAVDYE
ncbi:MAG: hypothetical protein QHI48_05350 [Bacteroidota bacterium]|nr:hypothetical protein [Bacteroidota bacterium]